MLDLFPGQILGQINPQVVLIAAVVHQAVRIVLVVGVGEGVGQIVGQLAQGVILPHGPGGPPLEPLDMGGDIGLGIAVIVPAELVGAQGTLQIGEWIAVRLEGAEQKRPPKTSGGESALAAQKRGCQQSMTAFLQDGVPPKHGLRMSTVYHGGIQLFKRNFEKRISKI